MDVTWPTYEVNGVAGGDALLTLYAVLGLRVVLLLLWLVFLAKAAATGCFFGSVRLAVVELVPCSLALLFVYARAVRLEGG